MKDLSIRVDVHHQSLKLAIEHSPRIAATNDVALGQRRDVRSGDYRPLTFIPRERTVPCRISICVARPRPGRRVTGARRIVPNKCPPVFGALIDGAALRGVREEQQCTQNKNAPPSHNLFLQAPPRDLLAAQNLFGKARNSRRFNATKLFADFELTHQLERFVAFVDLLHRQLSQPIETERFHAETREHASVDHRFA